MKSLPLEVVVLQRLFSSVLNQFYFYTLFILFMIF